MLGQMEFAIAFNVLMVVLAAAVAKRFIPVGFLTSFIAGLHYTIGISTPSQDQVRRAVLVWIASILIIVDVLFALLRWVL
jgi:hypothetical protein